MKTAVRCLLVILISLPLVGCATSKPLDSEHTYYTQQAIWVQKNLNWIGSSQWEGSVWRSHGVRRHIAVNTPVHVINVKSGIQSRSVVFQIESFNPSRISYEIGSANWKTLIDQSPVDLSEYPDRHQKLIRQGEVVEGMTKEEVRLAWGTPFQRGQLQWLYRKHEEDDLGVKFDAGKVTKVYE